MRPADREALAARVAELDAATEGQRARAVAAVAEVGEALEVRRGRGRPPVGPKVTGFRLEPGVLAEVEALADAEGTTRAELLRDLVDEALAARRQKAARRGQ